MTEHTKKPQYPEFDYELSHRLMFGPVAPGREHRPSARPICQKIDGLRHEDYEDVLHDAAIEFPKRVKTWKGKNFKGFLYKFLKNFTRDWRRKELDLRKKPENRPVVVSIDQPIEDKKGEKQEIQIADKHELDDLQYLHTIVQRAPLITNEERAWVWNYFKAHGVEHPFQRARKLLEMFPEPEDFDKASELDFRTGMVYALCNPELVSNEAWQRTHDFTVELDEIEKREGAPMDTVIKEILEARKQLQEREQSAIQRLRKEREEIMAEYQKRLDENESQLKQLGYTESASEKIHQAREVTKAGRVCGNCGKPGHNARTCAEKQQRGQKKAATSAA